MWCFSSHSSPPHTQTMDSQASCPSAPWLEVLRLSFAHAPPLCVQGYTDKIPSHLLVLHTVLSNAGNCPSGAGQDCCTWCKVTGSSSVSKENSCKDKVLVSENWKYSTSAFACSQSHGVERNSLGGCYGNKSPEVPTLLQEDACSAFRRKKLDRQTDLYFEHPGVSAKSCELEVRFLKASLWFGDTSPL